MASEFDESEFIDGDFEAAQKAAYSKSASSWKSGAGSSSSSSRAPTREELDAKVLDAQQKLTELRQAQENLERKRSQLEEARRRQNEFQRGRQEMLDNLTRGIGLLEEAEFDARREAEQMAKTLVAFREALEQIQSIDDEQWTKENYNTQLTAALTTIENARMEWNAARLKFNVLSGETDPSRSGTTSKKKNLFADATALSWQELARIGFAFTWPLAAAALLAGIAFFITALVIYYQ